MNRKETTKLLTDILVYDKLTDRKYYAKEVTLDYGTDHTKRIDVMQFIPQGVIHASDIEKGIFVCYEIKSCVQDVYSGNGLNFYGEKNYIVTTMETYKALQPDIRSGKLWDHIHKTNPESSKNFGILVPVPSHVDLRNTSQISEQYDKPAKLDGTDAYQWKLYSVMPCHEGHRDRAMSELLFCMLRSKHSNTD